MALRRICSVEGCDREVGQKGAKGMCSLHYKRSRSGSSRPLSRPAQERTPLPDICTMADCSKPAKARGWCDAHYMRWLTHGDPNIRGDPGGWSHRKVNDIMSFVEQADGCWEWLGYKDKSGYGWRSGKPAHRLIYEQLVGPIPEGLTLDHICRNHGCVNPEHLRPLSRSLNADSNRIKTHCPAGHPYEGANLHVDRKGGRRCRACAHERYLKLKRATV